MCKWGETTILRVPIPANLSYTGEGRWDNQAIDSCIAPIVQALNDGGVLTAASCCGHGREAGNIVLQDGRTLTITQQA